MNASVKNSNMKMILNSLPSRTWNRLGINESSLTIENTLQDRLPSVSSADKDIVSEHHACHIPLWDDIPGGAGKDMDVLTQPASTVSVEIPEGYKTAEPLCFDFSCGGGEYSASRLWFHAKKGSSVSAVISLRSDDPSAAGLSALQTKIYAEEGAKVHLYVVQMLGTGFTCLDDTAGLCDDDAGIEITKLELGSAEVYSGVLTNLKGRRSTFSTDLAYHVQSGQKLDMNYVALHNGKKTGSLMKVSGTLEEDARKVFRGTIDFRHGSSEAKGTEMENVMLFGENMVNQSIPLILCSEEDVEGNHGASIGQLDDKVLFYLASRGISPEAARHMIAQSRIDAVCAMIPSEGLEQEVHEFEEKRRLIYDKGKQK